MITVAASKLPSNNKKNNAKKAKRKKNKQNAVGSQLLTRQVVAPVAIGHVKRVREPRFVRSAKNGDVTVSHEELIAEVNGSVAFANTKIPINPGLIASFPWLAQMSPLYESYRFESLEFRFETSSNTTSTGTVMMAVDYDAADDAAASKMQLATYRGFIRSPPWKDCINHSIKEDLNKRKTYLVRSGSLLPNQDICLYDTGFLNLATQSQANNAQVGELYVRYTVRLMTPQLQDNGLGLARYARVTAASAAGLPVIAGNAPLDVSGTGLSITLTARSPYQCLLTDSFTGTGATVYTVNAASTATRTLLNSVVNVAGTLLSADVLASFGTGQTLILDLAAPLTYTARSLRAAQYAYALG